MHSTIKKTIQSFTHLFYPHVCTGCGTDVLGDQYLLCAKCMHSLPETHFFSQANNPVEKLFWGRIPIQHAGAAYYFTKESLVQKILVELKYKSNVEAGFFLGRKMGYIINQSIHFSSVDLIIPLPLNPKKEFIRGYNQAKILGEGMRESWQKPMIADAITRTKFTETQTHQNRISRWQNMERAFAITRPDVLENKHLLLIDDVITTGATLEACGAELLKIPGVRLSIASAAYTV